MALNTSIPQFSGRIGNLQFAIRNGKNIVHHAKDYSNRHKERMKNPFMDDYRDNLREFAAASQIASKIYSDLCPKPLRISDSTQEHTKPDAPGPIFRPYPHNHLTAKIKAAAAHQQKARCQVTGGRCYATEITVPDIAHALRDLDLSRETSPRAAVKISALGPQHNPTHLRITGLPEAAAAIQTPAGTLLECRIHIVQSRFHERRPHPVTNKWTETPIHDEHGQEIPLPQKLSPSDWIPAEIIPAEGIKLPIPENHADSQHITAVLIEWREHRTKGRRIVRLHDQGIVRIAAIHAPAKAWTSSHDQASRPAVHHIHPAKANLQAPTQPNWRKAPKEFLTHALTRIRPRLPVPVEAAASCRMPIEQLASGQRKR